jgi:hypothetical protein
MSGGFHVECRYSCEILINLNFFSGFLKTIQISNFMKLRSMGAELFHADKETDGRTDITKLIVASHNFVNAPKNEKAVPNVT